MITDLSQGTAQLLLTTHSRCCHKGCAILGAAALCQGLSTDNGREGTTCTCSCPLCVTRATGTSPAWASLKLHKGLQPWEHPVLTPWQGGAAGTLPGGPLGAEPLNQAGAGQSHGAGRQAASTFFVLGGFSPGTQAASQPLCAQQKGGTAFPAASLISQHWRPLRATTGSSGAGRQDFCGLGKGAQHPPRTGVPSPCAMPLCFAPFSPGHGWVQLDAVSRRRLPSVSSLLIQTQGAFPESARARPGTPLGRACSGQRRA